MARTKKAELERILESLEPIPRPRETLEQYPTPAGIAADVAYLALAKGDVAGRRVLDAGCGAGVLAIAVALVGADEVVGIDVDADAIEAARRNARTLGLPIEWRVADVGAVTGTFDTVLMNPPFGSQRRHADLPFLDKALDVGRVVYAFHNATTERFVVRRFAAAGARVTDRLEFAFPIRRMFPFHRKEAATVPVILFRVEAAKG
ncbi:MAG: METTL5 family protein [Methanobacteriota archaeon]